MKLTREQVEAAVKAKGHVWFEGAKDYDLNIVGVRNAATGQTVTNVFDDQLTVSYLIKLPGFGSLRAGQQQLILVKKEYLSFTILPGLPDWLKASTEVPILSDYIKANTRLLARLKT